MATEYALTKAERDELRRVASEAAREDTDDGIAYADGEAFQQLATPQTSCDTRLVEFNGATMTTPTEHFIDTLVAALLAAFDATDGSGEPKPQQR